MTPALTSGFMHSLLAVMCGGALGCALRWLLGAALNRLFPAIPPGTLVANLTGAYLIGLALAWFADHPPLAPHWRLFIITGFLGGLTTFSTFSAEIVTLLQQQRWLAACTAITLHLGGALLLTFAGIATLTWLRMR